MDGARSSQPPANLAGMSQHSHVTDYDREDSPMVDRPPDPVPPDQDIPQSVEAPQSPAGHSRAEQNTQDAWNSEDESMSDDLDDDENEATSAPQNPPVTTATTTVIPPVTENGTLPPPPPPPQITSPPPPAEEQSQWMPIYEDKTVPSKEELNWIEARGEHSALDDDYWTSRTFTDLRDPEYEIKSTGKIEWTVKKFNGTKEDPQKELVMRSSSVDIAGHRFRLKLYPKGNETLYLGVYLECETFDKEKNDSEDGESNLRALETPIPVVGKPPVDEPRVPAQFSVILYNPNEPRTHYHKITSHAFRRDAPDRGFSRFGPMHLYDLGRRLPEQRVPLLQNDTLAFVVHIRTFKDPTYSLFEATSSDDDFCMSFAKTGLNGLTRGGTYSYHDYTFVTAVSTWCMLPPFRRIIYNAEIPDRITSADKKPKPLLEAFHHVLYSMRNGDLRRAVSLKKIEAALHWHGTELPEEESDVFLTWGVLLDVLEKEVQFTSQAGAFRELFGLAGFRRKLKKERLLTQEKIELRNAEHVEDPDDKTVLGAAFSQSQSNSAQYPKILQIEIPRRIYDEKSREWKMASNRIQCGNTFKYDDSPSGSYYLFGMVSHRGHHQGGNYAPILRPDGKRWYTFLDAAGGTSILRLTHKQATRNIEVSAYIAIYVRQDIADRELLPKSPAFHSYPESTFVKPRFLDSIEGSEVGSEASVSPRRHSVTTPLEAVVLRSDIFLSHSERGFVDLFNPKFLKANPRYVTRIPIGEAETPKQLRRLCMQAFDDIQDPDQCILSYLNTLIGTELQPVLAPTALVGDAKIKDQFLKFGCPKYFWLHVIPLEDFQKYKLSSKDVVDGDGHTHTSQAVSTAEVDVVMSDTENDHPESVIPSANQPQATITDPRESQGGPGAVPLDGSIPVTSQSPTNGEHSPPHVDDWSRISDAQAWSTLSTHHDAIAQSEPYPDNLRYFFLKFFDPFEQTLISLGSYLADENEIISKVVTTKAGSELDTVMARPSLASLASQKTGKKFQYFQEKSILNATELQGSDSFLHNDFDHNGIIIITPVLSTDEKRGVERNGGLATPHRFVKYLSRLANHPARVAACEFRVKDHFASEYFKGSSTKGFLHGQGHLISQNGDSYNGQFIMGRREGKGNITYQNGNKYDGEWLDDQPNGKGTLVMAKTGNSYTGGFRAGKQHGQGVTTWKMAEEGSKECQVCYEQEMNCAFYDCGHVCACIDCGRQIDTCPICRRSVMKAMKLYYMT